MTTALRRYNISRCFRFMCKINFRERCVHTHTLLTVARWTVCVWWFAGWHIVLTSIGLNGYINANQAWSGSGLPEKMRCEESTVSTKHHYGNQSFAAQSQSDCVLTLGTSIAVRSPFDSQFTSITRGLVQSSPG